MGMNSFLNLRHLNRRGVNLTHTVGSLPWQSETLSGVITWEEITIVLEASLRKM
jgi:hypothetical protein